MERRLTGPSINQTHISPFPLHRCRLTDPLVEISYHSFVCVSKTWIKIDFGYMIKKPKTDGKMAMGSQKG